MKYCKICGYETEDNDQIYCPYEHLEYGGAVKLTYVVEEKE